MAQGFHFSMFAIIEFCQVVAVKVLCYSCVTVLVLVINVNNFVDSINCEYIVTMATSPQ